MAWNELTGQRTQRSRTYQNSLLPNQRSLSLGLAALHYPSALDSGVYDTSVDFTPVRINNAQLDGWIVNAAGWHYALGQPAGKSDGWVGFGGRQGAHWFQFRLLRLGYLHWLTRTWQDVGGTPSYVRTGGRLAQSTQTVTIGPSADIVAASSIATWTSIWTTPSGGRVDVSWRLDGDSLKEEVRLNQAGRTWVRNNRPPTTPASETYFGFVFQLDLSDLPHLHRGAVDLPIDASLDLADDDAPIELHDALDRLLGFLPIDDLIVRDPATGEEVARTPLRKRIYADGGSYYLLVGVRADVLNGLPAGDLVFDPTLNLAVGASSDDAYQNTSGVVDLTSVNLLNTTILRWTGWRFTGVTIAAADTISAATFGMTLYNTSWDDPDARFYCEDIGDSPTFTTGSNNISNRSITTANTLYSATGVGTGVKTVDVTSAVAETINTAAGWASGNALSVIAIDQGASNFRCRAYDNGSGYATLDIVYTAAGGGDLSVSKSDTVAASETVALLLESFISRSDSVALSEAVNFALAHNAATSDAAAVADTVELLLEHLPTVSDTVTVAEAVILAVETALGASDNVAVSEAVQLLLENLLAVSDSTSVSESAAARLENLVSPSEAIVLVEALELLLENYITVNDAIAVSENVTVQIPVAGELNIAVNDTVTTTETVSLQLTVALAVTDSVTLTENVLLATADLIVSVSDGVAVAEAVTIQIQVAGEINVTVSDTVTVSEAVSLSLSTPVLTASDTVTLSENAALLLESLVAVTDSLSVVETVSVELTLIVSVTETITLSEATSLVLSDMAIAISENLTLAENVALALFLPGQDILIAVSDTITVAELLPVYLAHLLTSTDRIFAVNAEDRVLAVHSQDRVLAVIRS